MNEPKQPQPTSETPVVSPRVNDRTYGERWYHAIFDWGLNYWANLTASAGFSQWAEHGTNPIKLPFLEKATPREHLANLSDKIRAIDPSMKSYEKKTFAAYDALKAEELVADRALARARSVTLLLPGFAVMIPAVWLGAKIKPWMVNKLNKAHYGESAMEDPTMIARQQAIESEARPTLFGTLIARFGTVFAAQATAQFVGSKNNFVNKLAENHNVNCLKEFGVNEFTESVGSSLGSALPERMREGINTFARKRGLNWSEEQIKDGVNLRFNPLKGKRENVAYSNATQDLGRFIVADTFYTGVTALTIHPILKLLRYIPFMSYKPKMPKDAAHFEGNTIKVPVKIKVPANQYADAVEADAPAQDATETPGLKVNASSTQGKLLQQEHQIA